MESTMDLYYRLRSKYDHNVIKSGDVGSKWGGSVPIEKNIRRHPKKNK